MSDWFGPRVPASTVPTTVGRVRAWCGSHLVLDWTGDQGLADRMAGQDSPRFALSRRVTVESAPNIGPEAEA